jgi:hypothetical protein
MFLLEVEPLDLGADVKAIGLELIEPENREPVSGAEAAKVWSRVLTALSATEPWAFDFFSHLERVREYCGRHGIAYREMGKCMVIGAPDADVLPATLERFEAETFGVRSGGPLLAVDDALERDLARRGVDAYHAAYSHYFFCGVCDLENGFLTLLTKRLWASEVIRRVTPVLTDLSVEARIPR